jgi:glyoxylase-like metal-dependent hydrolase (beta-lactamase superfamily II)
MQEVIRPITLSLPFRIGSVNSYLIKDELGYFLIGTGSSNSRTALEEELDTAGCKPGDLRLIALTHGDFDHTGNAAYLKNKFNTKIAMHFDDLGMVEGGDMFWNRNKPNILVGKIVSILFGFGKSKRFRSDIFLEEGTDLSEFGFEAKVIEIPGHSKGSVGFLTTAGGLICGDLFENLKEPKLNSMMDDPEAAIASVEKLKSFEI